MDKMLLLMPSFMNYEQALIDELKGRYRVTFIDTDSNMRMIRDKYYSNKVNRLARKLCKPLKTYEQELILRDFENDLKNGINFSLNAYDVIFAINGHGITNNTYRKLLENNKQARTLLYLWDDSVNLFKTTHIQMFQEKWSYNIDDCNRFHMEYLPMFVQETDIDIKENRKYDIAIIASAHSDRVSFTKTLYKKYSTKLDFYIYFYDPENVFNFFSYDKPLSYKEYLNILSESRAVIDIPNIIQNGPTTRVFDALCTKTKVISTNKDLQKYPVYGKNVMVVDRVDPVIDVDFLMTPFSEEGKQYYILNDWLEKLNL